MCVNQKNVLSNSSVASTRPSENSPGLIKIKQESRQTEEHSI